MTKKILITTESLVMGGVETSLLDLLKILSKYDTSIDLYVTKKGELIEEAEKITNVNVIPVKIPNNKLFFRIQKNLLCKSLFKKYKKLNNKKYDVAIAYYGINNYSDMYAAACNCDKKIIWVHNNFESSYKMSKIKLIIKLRNLIMKRKFKYFDNIIAVSNSAKEGFLRVFDGFEKKVQVINNTFDINKLKKADEKCEFEMIGKNKLIYVGRLVSTKCVDKLILECQKVMNDISDTYLYILGDGTELEYLKNIVKELKLEDKIFFFGNQVNPYKYMKQADIVVTASILEANSINSLESLAMKKYFVSADNEGAKDIYYGINQGNDNNGIICSQDQIHKYIKKYILQEKKVKPNFDMKKYNDNVEMQLVNLFGIKKK